MLPQKGSFKCRGQQSFTSSKSYKSHACSCPNRICPRGHHERGSTARKAAAPRTIKSRHCRSDWLAFARKDASEVVLEQFAPQSLARIGVKIAIVSLARRTTAPAPCLFPRGQLGPNPSSARGFDLRKCYPSASCGFDLRKCYSPSRINAGQGQTRQWRAPRSATQASHVERNCQLLTRKQECCSGRSACFLPHHHPSRISRNTVSHDYPSCRREEGFCSEQSRCCMCQQSRLEINIVGNCGHCGMKRILTGEHTPHVIPAVPPQFLPWIMLIIESISKGDAFRVRVYFVQIHRPAFIRRPKPDYIFAAISLHIRRLIVVEAFQRVHTKRVTVLKPLFAHNNEMRRCNDQCQIIAQEVLSVVIITYVPTGAADRGEEPSS